jgi:CRISPR-associated protein Cas1
MPSSPVLAIDKYGAYVKRSGNCFLVKTGDEVKEYSADKISQLLFIRHSAISTEAINLAVEKNIDIVYLDKRGKPFARTYRPEMGGTTLTRRKQLEACFSKKGCNLVKAFVEGKTKSQINYLKSLAKDRKENDQLKELSRTRVPHLSEINGAVDNIRNKILGIEGSTAAKYFKALSLITGFPKRDPRSTDAFNICLNYAYGILYSEVERACILAGLDPYLGFYHTDRYGKPSLVLDVMELFRVAVADRAVVTLFNRREINKNDFEKIGEPILTQEGRRKVIKAVINRLNTKITHFGKRLALKPIILSQTRELAGYLLGHRRNFNPFVYK